MDGPLKVKLIEIVLAKAGVMRTDGLVFTKEGLESALPSTLALPGVKSAHIEGDELRVVMEPPTAKV